MSGSRVKYGTSGNQSKSFFLSFFLLILARSNFDHYARECNFGILKKKQKQNKKNKNKTKKQKNLSAVQQANIRNRYNQVPHLTQE